MPMDTNDAAAGTGEQAPSTPAAPKAEPADDTRWQFHAGGEGVEWEEVSAKEIKAWLAANPTKADADANRQPIDRLIVTLQATSDGGPTYPDQVNAHPTIYGALAQAIQQLALQVYPDATAYGTP